MPQVFSVIIAIQLAPLAFFIAGLLYAKKMHIWSSVAILIGFALATTSTTSFLKFW